MAVYRCAGRNRTNPETGTPLCAYEAERPWGPRCPACGMPYTPLKVGSELRRERHIATAADSHDPKHDPKHIATGVEAFDELTSGGVVLSQQILLAGQSGTRKTSLCLKVLESLAHRTERPLLFASAEQNEHDVKMFCRMLGVSNPQIKILGNVADVDDVLTLCDQIKPLVCVLDSLQLVADHSGKTDEVVAQRMVEHGKRTKMISVMVSHMTKGFEIKGGTGAPYIADTVLAFEPFIPELDGDPVDLFGRQALRDIGVDYDPMFKDEPVENLRLLKTIIKNRYGPIGAKAYFFTTPEGGLEQLKKKSKIIPFGRPE